jgi:hypothetical protein
MKPHSHVTPLDLVFSYAEAVHILKCFYLTSVSILSSHPCPRLKINLVLFRLKFCMHFSFPPCSLHPTHIPRMERIIESSLCCILYSYATWVQSGTSSSKRLTHIYVYFIDRCAFKTPNPVTCCKSDSRSRSSVRHGELTESGAPRFYLRQGTARLTTPKTSPRVTHGAYRRGNCVQQAGQTSDSTVRQCHGRLLKVNRENTNLSVHISTTCTGLHT